MYENRMTTDSEENHVPENEPKLDAKTEAYLNERRENLDNFKDDTEKARAAQYLDYVEWVESHYPDTTTAAEQQAAVFAGLLKTASEEAIEEAYRLAREEYIPRTANDPLRAIRRLAASIGLI